MAGGGQYVILVENKLSQTSPTSRRPLLNSRIGLNASSSGVMQQLLSINPGVSAEIPACSVFFSLNSSDTLFLAISSIDPVSGGAQLMNVNVNRIFSMAVPLTGIAITNKSTTEVVECRVVYS